MKDVSLDTWLQRMIAVPADTFVIFYSGHQLYTNYSTFYLPQREMESWVEIILSAPGIEPVTLHAWLNMVEAANDLTN